jgi:hypothetical protein
MKNAFSSALAIALAGCASYANFQAQPPAFEGRTDKAPDAFVACATPKIVEIWPDARVIPDGETRVVLVNSANGVGTVLTLSARPRPSGTEVALRQMTSVRTFSKEWDAVRVCL